MRWFCRVYMVMLYAYPREFRLQFGGEMQQLFRDRCRQHDAHSRPPALASFRHARARPIGFPPCFRKGWPPCAN